VSRHSLIIKNVAATETVTAEVVARRCLLFVLVPSPYHQDNSFIVLYVDIFKLDFNLVIKKGYSRIII